jgi:hypothetical protein
MQYIGSGKHRINAHVEINSFSPAGEPIFLKDSTTLDNIVISEDCLVEKIIVTSAVDHLNNLEAHVYLGTVEYPQKYIGSPDKITGQTLKDSYYSKSFEMYGATELKPQELIFTSNVGLESGTINFSIKCTEFNLS